MESTFLVDDLAIEVLSRLPAKNLSASKCVSKRWNSLISNPSFLRIHSQRSDGPLGLFFQMYEDLVIYVCNPSSKDWIALRPDECCVGDSFGIAFCPFGSSSNTTPGFKLVSIQRAKAYPNSYNFVMYSSETGRWTTSKEVCYCNYRIHKNRQIFVGHRFHWLTWNHHIITFDVEREMSGVIKLPGPVMDGGEGRWVCLGGSEGYLHYVCAHVSELRVWMLKDYCKPEWMLKHRLNLIDFCIEHSALFSLRLLDVFTREKTQHETLTNNSLLPLAFDEDILFMNLERKLFRIVSELGGWRNNAAHLSWRVTLLVCQLYSPILFAWLLWVFSKNTKVMGPTQMQIKVMLYHKKDQKGR